MLEHLSPEELQRRENMPSTEHPGLSRCGVGSLPGKRSEQNVALLPEERLHPAGASLFLRRYLDDSDCVCG